MKNIFNTEENLDLFNENGTRVYEYRKNSKGFSYECTRDSSGNVITYKDSNGNELTYKNSDGVSRGFDIPEYTMEELVNKLGNFKIKI